MTKNICLRNGLLTYDARFILLNPEDASTSCTAYVIECRNSDAYGMLHYGESIPHFLFLAENCNEDDEEFYEVVHEYCQKAWPNFRDVLEHQVVPIKDSTDKQPLANVDEWNAAPNIGYFRVLDEDDPLFKYCFCPEFPAKIQKNGV